MSERHQRPKRRRWFQVSLRMLLLLFLACSVVAGLVARRLSYARSQKAAIAELIDRGALIGYGNGLYQFGNFRFRSPSGISGRPLGASPTKQSDSTWLTALLGEDFFVNVTEVSLEAKRVGGASGRQVLPDFDAAIAPLESLVHLEKLNLSGGRFTAHGLSHLRALRRLRVLELQSSSITDTGLKRLPALPLLRELDVRDTMVTEEGLFQFTSSPHLKKLYVIDSAVTARGVKELRTRLPQAKVYDQIWRGSAEPFP